MNITLCKLLAKKTPLEVIPILFFIISIYAASCTRITINVITCEIYEIKYNVNVTQNLTGNAALRPKIQQSLRRTHLLTRVQEYDPVFYARIYFPENICLQEKTFTFPVVSAQALVLLEHILLHPCVKLFILPTYC
jgi:hypothetical protein